MRFLKNQNNIWILVGKFVLIYGGPERKKKRDRLR